MASNSSRQLPTWLRAVACLAVGIGAAGIIYLMLPQRELLPIVQGVQERSESPALCPWRDPKRDLRSLFPGADGYDTRVLVLSSLRTRILDALGPGGRLDENILQVYPVRKLGKPIGTVLVRRANGKYGAIEVVAGISPDKTIAGVVVQRHREAGESERLMSNSSWLSEFAGKSASSDFELGAGLPKPSSEAAASAEAVSRAVRSVLVEFTIGSEYGSLRDPDEL